MPRGSVTDEQMDFVETWEGLGETTHWIWRFDSRGEPSPFEVQGHQRFTLTTAERFFTQEKIRAKGSDPFTNGDFLPIVVPEDVTTATNPNALTDDNIRQMFRLGAEAWEASLESVDSPRTLQRMLQLAEAEGSDISLQRYRQLEDRAKEIVGGPPSAVSKDQHLFAQIT